MAIYSTQGEPLRQVGTDWLMMLPSSQGGFMTELPSWIIASRKGLIASTE